MREMKDSGILWVREIPKGWNVKKIKHISHVIGGNGFNVELQGLESGDYAGGANALQESRAFRRTFYANDKL